MEEKYWTIIYKVLKYKILIETCFWRVTDETGEVHNLITDQQFPAGVYRVDFDTKAYWKSQGSTPFHEMAEVSMTI